MNYYLYAVLALTAVGSGVAFLLGRIVAGREAQVPTDVLGRRP